ncbi:MAG: hypothetical protein FWG12_08005 [Holophagaceae bacterium]|nr:hypothetical protein [Holophagaceae bacterium]
MQPIVFAEVSKADNILVHIGQAPVIPEFGPNAVNYCVDITDIDPMPQIGWLYDPETGAFSPPAPLDAWEGYIGELTLHSVQGGIFNEDRSEVNAFSGQKVSVEGEVTDQEGNVISFLDVDVLRLPILQTDLIGNPLEHSQPSMALATIRQGIVNAFWIPENTGTFKITDRGVNIRLPKGSRIKFKGLEIFVLPENL